MSTACAASSKSAARQLGHRVALVANYDNCRIDDSVADTYAAMVRYLQMRYYSGASRYSTSAFLRSKLGAALQRRSVAPHIFESAQDARRFAAADDGRGRGCGWRADGCSGYRFTYGNTARHPACELANRPTQARPAAAHSGVADRALEPAHDSHRFHRSGPRYLRVARPGRALEADRAGHRRARSADAHRRWPALAADAHLHAAPLRPRGQAAGHRLRAARPRPGRTLGDARPSRRPAGDAGPGAGLQDRCRCELVSADRRRHRLARVRIDPGRASGAGARHAADRSQRHGRSAAAAQRCAHRHPMAAARRRPHKAGDALLAALRGCPRCPAGRDASMWAAKPRRCAPSASCCSTKCTPIAARW